MQAIIGQEELYTKLNALTAKTRPKTILLLGEKGCGKHTVAMELVSKFKDELVVITEKLSSEDLLDFYYGSEPTTYLIDLSTISIKQQNQFLKFIEEPPALGHIILLAESELAVLPTIINRCVKYQFKPNSKATLKQCRPDIIDENIFDICTTVGQLKDISQEQVSALYGLCIGMLESISDVPYAPVIALARQVNYKDEYNKFDFNNFIKAMALAAFNLFVEKNDQKFFKLYSYITQKVAEIRDRAPNKEAFIISLLDGIWRLAN